MRNVKTQKAQNENMFDISLCNSQFQTLSKKELYNRQSCMKMKYDCTGGK